MKTLSILATLTLSGCASSTSEQRQIAATAAPIVANAALIAAEQASEGQNVNTKAIAAEALRQAIRQLDAAQAASVP